MSRPHTPEDCWCQTEHNTTPPTHGWDDIDHYLQTILPPTTRVIPPKTLHERYPER